MLCCQVLMHLLSLSLGWLFSRLSVCWRQTVFGKFQIRWFGYFWEHGKKKTLVVLWPCIWWRWFRYTSYIRRSWSFWESEIFGYVKKHFLWDLNSRGIVFWSREKIFGLGSVLWWGYALCEASDNLPELISIIILSQCSGCVLLGEELLSTWPLPSLKMLSAQGMLNIPALLGAEQLLPFLGRMRALQLVADGLSGLYLQFFQGVASTVSI